MSRPNFKALYGTFDQHMLPLIVIDVTDQVVELLLSIDKIIVPAQSDFNQLFGDPVFGERKFLQIKTKYKNYNINEDEYQLEMIIELNEVKNRIKMVYFIYINRASNWQEIISGQLLQLKGYGLLDEVDLYVHITDTLGIFDEAIGLVLSLCEKAIVSVSIENQFEYPAIRLVYDLAGQDPDSIYLYLHTKGMSYNTQSRLPIDVALLKGTFENWRRHLEAFANIKINKLGLFPSFENPGLKHHFGIGEGWIRFNFWYVRGNYIVNYCHEPIVQSFRYYWEIWVAGAVNKKIKHHHDCYNLYFERNQRYFNVTDATIRVNYLIRNLKKQGK